VKEKKEVHRLDREYDAIVCIDAENIKSLKGLLISIW